jgi:fructose-specific phosphotransferase system IIC component
MLTGLVGLAFITYHFITTPSLDFMEMVKAAGLGLIVAGIAAAMLGAAQMLAGGGRRRK